MTDASNTDLVTERFEIPAVNMPVFEKKMSKLSKKAKRLGADDVGFIKLDSVVKTFTQYNEETDETEEMETVFDVVEVFGPRPKMEGWTFVGRLDFTAAAPAVLRAMVPGESCPEAFYDVEPGRCDHCNKSRRRKDSFIVRHEDGTEKLVGRRCLADFLGHQSPESIARLAELLASVVEEGRQAGRGGYGGIEMHDPARVLALAAYSVRTRGWASSQSERATRGDVSFLLAPPLRPTREEAEERRRRLAEVSDADRERASEIMEWVHGLDTHGNDYYHNLQLSLGGPVTYKTLGIAVSAVVAYDKAMERETKRVARARRFADDAASSEFQGAVKERLDFAAEAYMIRELDSAWGLTTMIKLRDDNGNVYTWFASGAQDVEQGKRYNVRGTVKKHEVYQGLKQTVITRCKLKEAV